MSRYFDESGVERFGEFYDYDTSEIPNGPRTSMPASRPATHSNGTHRGQRAVLTGTFSVMDLDI